MLPTWARQRRCERRLTEVAREAGHACVHAAVIGVVSVLARCALLRAVGIGGGPEWAFAAGCLSRGRVGAGVARRRCACNGGAFVASGAEVTGGVRTHAVGARCTRSGLCRTFRAERPFWAKCAVRLALLRGVLPRSAQRARRCRCRAKRTCRARHGRCAMARTARPGRAGMALRQLGCVAVCAGGARPLLWTSGWAEVPLPTGNAGSRAALARVIALITCLWWTRAVGAGAASRTPGAGLRVHQVVLGRAVVAYFAGGWGAGRVVTRVAGGAGQALLHFFLQCIVAGRAHLFYRWCWALVANCAVATGVDGACRRVFPLATRHGYFVAVVVAPVPSGADGACDVVCSERRVATQAVQWVVPATGAGKACCAGRSGRCGRRRTARGRGAGR